LSLGRRRFITQAATVAAATATTIGAARPTRSSRRWSAPGTTWPRASITSSWRG